jgi:predicted peptidase
MGGAGTNNLVVDYPDTFAEAVPICSGTSYSDEEYKNAFMRMNVFYVVAENDSASLVQNTKHFVELIPHAESAIYPNNLIDGVDYPGHWSWIWVGRNEPKAKSGESLYEWMASKSVDKATFTLKAHTYDWGEGINQVVISVPGKNFSRVNIGAEAFKVYATGTYPGGVAYENAERIVQSVTGGNGTITLNLKTDFGDAGAGTLAYTGRNVVTTQSYEIMQTMPITARDGTEIGTNTYRYAQSGQWTNDEVDAFEYGSKDNIVYRFYKPSNYDDGAKHPLLVWLHGAGESGNNNETQIRANRGALGWVTPEAQSIFGGAFVLAPETNSGWSDADCASVIALIDDLAGQYNIDMNRLHVAGCSMGGGGTLRIATSYPDEWATVVPICAAIGVSDDVIKETLSNKEVWFIHAANDTTVNVSGSRRLHALLENSHYTEYENNLIDGFDYPGHWSWIWFGRNDPKLEDGTTIFEWEANARKIPSDLGAEFTLKAKVYDWGEGVNQVVIDGSKLTGIKLNSLTKDDFVISVNGINTSNGAQVYNGVAREIKNLSVARNGTITIDLVTEYGTPGAGTLAYSGRNNLINLDYKISLTKDVEIGETEEDKVTIPASSITFKQVGGFEKDGEIVTTFTDDEVDQFLYGQMDAVPYRLFVPANADNGAKHPLLLWLHGAGESGNNNEAQIRANRGALGWVTPEAQEIFDGAFVLAPETSSGWSAVDVQTVINIIDELAGQYAIDLDRVHVAGCSMGGGGTMRIATTFPERFATVVPICAAGSGGADDAKVVETLGNKEVWFIHAKNDTTVNVSGSQRLHALLENSHYSEYENNVVDGVDYPGHWSWIWFGNNDPKLEDGTSVFEWEAAHSSNATEAGTATFELKAKVYDWGEGVNQIVINGAPIAAAVNLSALTPEDLVVSVYGTNTSNGAAVYSGVAREIESLNVSRNTITLNLVTEFGTPGAGTLAYSGRNNIIDLRYQISLKSDSSIKFEQVGGFEKDGVVVTTYTDAEVDQFLYGKKDNVPYRLYVPANADNGAKHPLLLWLHGAGESGQVNEAQIRANRGALGWVTPEAQEIFGGAFVLAPETGSGWNNADVTSVNDLIKELAEEYAIDLDRVHVAGCSMGGGGTMRIATTFPDTFATVVPICAAGTGGASDEKVVETLGNKEVWFIHAANDTTVNVSGSQRLHALLENSHYNEYENNVVDGVDYPGHWSWIWFGNNDPKLEDGTTIFEWEANTSKVAATTGTATFTLKAHVFDWGEGICQAVIDASELGLDEEALKALTPADFNVVVYGNDTSNGAVAYDGVSRIIDGVEVDGTTICLNLNCDFGSPAAGTLAYSGRNNLIDLRYQISLASAPQIKFEQVGGFEKDGEIVTNFTDDEVDQFLYGKKDAVPYRFFIPENANDGAKHPLLLWLHGAGESGQNNEAQIRANRGALGWATPEAQEIFGGAFVLAPETASGWSDTDVASVIAIIDELSAQYAIDANRMHVAGCSMGGGGTYRIALRYPERWASIAPICAARPNIATDEEVVAKLGDKNVWIIQAANDSAGLVNSSRALHDLLKNSIYTEYENNLIDGTDYPGHWSWIWFANNDPTNKGQTIFEWEAAARDNVALEATFDLKAHVFDYGESINQAVIHGLANAGAYGADDFIVRASAVRSDNASPVFTRVERTISSVAVEGEDLILNLACQFGGAGEGTLTYQGGRNLSTDQTYEIVLKKDSSIVFKQNGNFTDDEVDAFQSGSLNGVQYRFYLPDNYDDGQDHPLLLWLHGAGERGTNNSSQIRANRGALGWVTPEAQEIFGGAFVLAPQSTQGWNDAEVATVMNIITYLEALYNIDENRVHVAGCSMGGGGTTRIATAYPDAFASIVPICAAASASAFPDEYLVEKWSDKNVWLIHAANDTSVNPDGSSRRIHAALPNSYYTEYETVTLDGVDYPGHWSWIYFALNMPVNDKGQTVFEWEAACTNAEPEDFTGFKWIDGGQYWYEHNIRQGVYGDEKNIWDTQFELTERGREIYDPDTNAWYWLDAIYDGNVAKDKEVWMPYIYQNEEPGSTNGKWVRYDRYGQMIKGWFANDNGVYYYDLTTGAMFYGTHEINGKTYTFDPVTGIMQ